MNKLAVLILSVLVTVGLSPDAVAAPEASTDAAAHADDHGDHGGDHGGGHGAHGGHEEVGVVPTGLQALAPMITAVVVFAIVVYIMGTVVWPKVSGGLEDRANKIRDEIAAAEAARAQSKSALEEYERSLAQARADAQQMLDETKAKQSELAAELRAKNDREIQGLRDKAMQDIEAARKAALNEIYADSVALATTMAGKILKREVNASDAERLVAESLDELGAHRNN